MREDRAETVVELSRLLSGTSRGEASKERSLELYYRTAVSQAVAESATYPLSLDRRGAAPVTISLIFRYFSSSGSCEVLSYERRFKFFTLFSSWGPGRSLFR